MGELIDYYIIESVVEYNDDPFKIGRIRCSIPGVISHETTPKEALPWVRPFKMYCYQTFTKPLVGQKVWVMVNKSNYNEFWWFPFYETIDIVQGYLNEYYDETPDVFHAREDFVTPVMHTWDDKQGYKWVIAEDYIDFFPTREFKLKVNECNINVVDNIIQIGGDGEGNYEKAVKGETFETWRNGMKDKCMAVAQEAKKDSHTMVLVPSLIKLAQEFTKYAGEGKILCKKCHVN